MKKSILMIGNTSWGMYRFRGDLIHYLVSLGFKIIVVAPLDAFSSCLTDLGAEHVELAVDRKGTNPFRDLIYFFKLVKIIFYNRPDVVFSYTIKPVLYGTLAAWVSGVPQRVAVITGLGNTFNSENLINKITKMLYKICLHFSTQVWVLNSEDMAIFLNHGLVVKEKFFLLPGEGVDTRHYDLCEKPVGITFSAISRMLWDKGIGIFVESARILKPKYPEITFNIVGPVDNDNPEGISLEQLKSWHAEGVVNYLGSTNDVKSILQKTNCLVHPTYYKEGLPRNLLEASSMGIPCITTNIPGCKDVVLDGVNGFLINPENIQDLVSAMIKFIHLTSEDRMKMSLNGRRRVEERFSAELINSIYLSKICYS
jgi:glycosyltransferase involved in cell wall biosynthesis